MTGRRLYDHFVDATATQQPLRTTPPVAWPYLSKRDQRVWNAMARRITPKKRRSA